MYCYKCGAKVADDATFCETCGARLKTTHAATSAVVEQAVKEHEAEQSTATSPQTMSTASIQDDTISPKSRLVASLFCFLFGGLGVHDFYLGKKVLGLVKIILLVVALIGAGVYVGAFAKVADRVASGGSVPITDGMRIGVILMGIPIIILSIWILVDFITILAGSAKDKQDKKVKNWMDK